MSLKEIFYPKTIAIIGASDNPQKFGYEVTKNIITNKDDNLTVFPIHPSSEEVLGLKVNKSVLDVADDIDLAIILVGQRYVIPVVKECAQKKVKGLIIVTAGFSEINEEGRKLEEEIKTIANEAGISIIGPNCVGIINMDHSLNASFIETPLKGSIAMIAQSGSFGAACFYTLSDQNIGISKFANLGNMIDINYSDLLPFYRDDENINSIGLYIEAVKKGREFYETLKEITPKKPVVILKGGRTEQGTKSALSHTGSLSSGFNAFKAAATQAGALMANTIGQLTSGLKALSMIPPAKGDRVAVITNAGGVGVILSDELFDYDITLNDFSEEIQVKLKEGLNPLVKPTNPVDTIASAREKEYYHATKTLLEANEVDIVIAECVIPTFLEMKSDEHIKGAINAWNDTGRKKPLLLCWMSGHLVEKPIELCGQENVPIFLEIENVAFACHSLVHRWKVTNKLK
ncbi:MAG: CoA-binding protein [Candidatus Heimdallarchaeota archaeon]|nr:CoA-binding protein [Candidatus Heimdallarchaeota archaeon]MCK5048602.1 CoA-binding protein [Candidatus Heimdallarchaeota archaeon]